MLNGIITPLSADPLLTFCASLFDFSKCFSFQMANYRAGEESEAEQVRVCSEVLGGWVGGCVWMVVVVVGGGSKQLSEDQTSHTLMWSNLGELFE